MITFERKAIGSKMTLMFKYLGWLVEKNSSRCVLTISDDLVQTDIVS